MEIPGTTASERYSASWRASAVLESTSLLASRWPAPSLQTAQTLPGPALVATTDTWLADRVQCAEQ